MVFDKTFIWSKDHYVHHLTTRDKIAEIITKGLVPRIGTRSESINDKNKAIYFFDSITLLDDWIEELYKDRNKSDLELLRFNLKNRKWFHRDIDIGDFYLKTRVNPNSIEFLSIYDDSEKIIISEENIEKHKSIWKKIKDYK